MESHTQHPGNGRGSNASVRLLAGFCTLFVLLAHFSVSANPLRYAAGKPSKGKHLVLVASDHEYRSEETIPALARILAVRHGFDCTVLFGLDANGHIEGGASNIPGLEALEKADGLVIFTRFLALPPEQMKHIDAYLQRGGPVVGLRTATHGFKYDKPGDPYYKYHFRFEGKDYQAGFGHQVLGQSWVGHYGKNHQQSTRITAVPSQSGHPILKGVKDVHVQAGGYNAEPAEDWTILTMAQPLMSMDFDGKPDSTKPPMASEWTREYTAANGRKGRVFTSLYGASEDLLNPGYRRLLVNGIYWSLGLEKQIQADSNIDFVGPYQPNTFRNKGYARGVKPSDYASLQSPIPANHQVDEPVAKPAPRAQAAPAAKASSGSGKAARFVRIELSGRRRILTLAEVEVFSGGKNVAPQGKAKQSTTHGGGEASRAIDGNRSGDWGKGGQTHTANGGEDQPWWELDLGKALPVDSVRISNRLSPFDVRLDGFTLTLLDEQKKSVFSVQNVRAPQQAVEIHVSSASKPVYLTLDGKPGKEASAPAPAPAKEAAPAAGANLAEVPKGYRDPSPFQFQKGDVIAIVGNGLADRMQHDGWTETLIQSQLPSHQLAFRNMSLTGDRPNHYPRSKGFTPMTEYLRQVKADVVFAMFGYNESYGDAAKLEDFRKDLREFIRVTRGSKANGKSLPRIVLFSPIAHENLGDPNLPDGVENNLRLSMYSRAMQEVARQEGVAFVDLFNPSLDLYESQEAPLTLNGVHLNTEGNRLVGEAIARALLKKDVVASASLEDLRQAVLDKNWHWHNRYRATDGNDVWGGRSTLRFVNDQTNAEVLQHELVMLDQMTANRDRHIWAVSNGSFHRVDDSNVPKPIPVISNIGGGSKSSNAEKEGNPEYISGEAGIAHMALRDGFEVNLFADEERFPQLVNPVQMQVDTKGRLWVAAWPTYPKWEPLKEMNDALLILHDDDKDGRADRVTEFARVHNPLGFEFWNGGVVVTSQPDILFLKDTDGDDKADVRIVLFQGIGSSDTHHAANNLILGPDGGIYWQSGIFLQHNHEHPWGPSLEATQSGMYRFDPRRYTIAAHGANSPNPHGIAFDTWGYHYATDGTGGRAYQVRIDDKDGWKMHELLKKEVRPVPACEVISSANFPESMQGDFMICNSIGFLGIKQYALARDPEKGSVWGEPSGGDLTVTKTMPDGKKIQESSKGLMMSGDKNFRPTDAVFGEDGALYISDWHNVIIGHMQHNVRDPNRDHQHGRVYRMVAKGRPLQKPVKIDGQPVTALLENLKHPIDGVRHRTRVELSEHDTTEVMTATRKWMRQFDAKKKEDALPLLEALWIHQRRNLRDVQLLNALLASPEPHARNAAKVVQHHWFKADPAQGGLSAPLQFVEEKVEVVYPKHLAKKDYKLFELGSEVYHRDAHCVTCHQPSGQGMVNIYPPLKESPWVVGDDERAIKLTLNGLYGPITVNGVKYDASRGVPPMTAFRGILNDEEVAAVLTFVRNSWGNQAPAVSPEKVAKVRAATKDQTGFWSPDVLLQAHPLER